MALKPVGARGHRLLTEGEAITMVGKNMSCGINFCHFGDSFVGDLGFGLGGFV